MPGWCRARQVRRCAIAPHTIQVLGFGLHQARGIKSGVVVDLDQAESSIRLAVDAAERQADITVESLIVNISCGRLKSDTLSASVSLQGHEVDDRGHSPRVAGRCRAFAHG